MAHGKRRRRPLMRGKRTRRRVLAGPPHSRLDRWVWARGANWRRAEKPGRTPRPTSPWLRARWRSSAFQPDFACEGTPEGMAPRRIHKRIGDADIYFVANKDGLAHDFVCSFRVDAKRPEFWWPDTGRTETAAAFESAEGRMRVPLRLEPYGSVFVVFRKPIARFDPVVAATRDGATLLPSPAQKSVVVVQKAVYGLPRRSHRHARCHRKSQRADRWRRRVLPCR